MNLISVAALSDNYIWLLYDVQHRCVIVDPGESESVLQALRIYQLMPVAILLTHHHRDHVAGVPEILNVYHNLQTYGPQETAQYGVTHIVHDGDRIHLLNLDFSVFFVPGHTLGHISYYSTPFLFCGDTLFSAGCGRVFEGTLKQMYESIKKISTLPDDTRICCAHEYTQSNLEFANTIWPEECNIVAYLSEVRLLRAKSQSTLPTTLGLERKINLFFRCHDMNLKEKLKIKSCTVEDWRVFAKLRSKKDSF
ncbi:MAG: hydroxyacylglutathione hydrolase [Candidatus Malihini olakiniferum]